MMAGDFDFGKISTSDDVDLNSIKDVDVPDERSLEAGVDADDNYDAEVKTDERSQQLDFKSLEQGVKLFDDQMFEGGEDNPEFYDDLPDEEDDSEWEDDEDESDEEDDDQ